ncbi:g3456 [Coccomyxa elongata]
MTIRHKMEATSANPLQLAAVTPPDYDFIKIDAPAQDTCYGILSLLRCCMIQACLSPKIIRIKNRMANRGRDFVRDSALRRWCASCHRRDLISDRRRCHPGLQLQYTALNASRGTRKVPVRAGFDLRDRDDDGISDAPYRHFGTAPDKIEA